MKENKKRVKHTKIKIGNYPFKVDNDVDKYTFRPIFVLRLTKTLCRDYTSYQ
jgi:hypothetical protein